jgi:hypothetical protein
MRRAAVAEQVMLGRDSLAAAFGCTLPRRFRDARLYSPDEITALAERIRLLVEVASRRARPGFAT